MRFGLCVIGCGAFAGTFARAVQGELGDMALYFASRDAGSFGSYESVVAAYKVDAVYACAPYDIHLPPGRIAATGDL